MPPSSSGPGRGPLKAKTRIRIPLEAPSQSICYKKKESRIPFFVVIFYSIWFHPHIKRKAKQNNRSAGLP